MHLRWQLPTGGWDITTHVGRAECTWNSVLLLIYIKQFSKSFPVHQMFHFTVLVQCFWKEPRFVQAWQSHGKEPKNILLLHWGFPLHTRPFLEFEKVSCYLSRCKGCAVKFLVSIMPMTSDPNHRLRSIQAKGVVGMIRLRKRRRREETTAKPAFCRIVQISLSLYQTRFFSRFVTRAISCTCKLPSSKRTWRQLVAWLRCRCVSSKTNSMGIGRSLSSRKRCIIIGKSQSVTLSLLRRMFVCGCDRLFFDGTR